MQKMIQNLVRALAAAMNTKKLMARAHVDVKQLSKNGRIIGIFSY